jgi:DNA-binding NarL/FixJ family response regulator
MTPSSRKLRLLPGQSGAYSPGELNITVSIIEDDACVRRILARWISKADGFTFITGYGNGQSATAHLPSDGPDVVLVDINLAGQSGIQCVQTLKPVMPKTQFIMLTVYEDADHIFNALTAGATGYLLKRTPADELLASIRQVHEGGSPMSSCIARKVVQAFQPVQTEPSQPDGLSPREWEVLGLLARGYVYKEIAESLGISISTVNTHLHRIYEKLQVRSRSQAIARYSKMSPRPLPSPASRSSA